MLLILFGAPAVFDRYRIRNQCEAFTEGHKNDSNSFCSHSDVTELAMASGYENTLVCESVVFPLADGSTCPAFDEPSDESVRAAVLQGATCVGEACNTLLKDAQAVCHHTHMPLSSFVLLYLVRVA